jgi:predicted metalloprotease
MRDDDLRPSGNIDDRRGQGGGGFNLGRGGLGIGTIIVLGLISWALGINPAILINGAQMIAGGDTSSVSQPSNRPTAAPDDRMGIFVAKILGETEDVWSQVLPAQANRSYQKPILVLFSGATGSACGGARSAMGPFYCPDDRKVYLDTSFFQDMQRRMGGGGDFAFAYVIAHEIGHHVQNLLGVLSQVQGMERDRASANAVSVRTELMADCFAGVWANWMNQRHANIDDSDVRQAINTAAAIGDDRLQRQSRGVAIPDSFTHGSSAQRVRWLTIGLRNGNIRSCDTFGAGEP